MRLISLALAAAFTLPGAFAAAQTYPSQSETPITDDAELLEPVEEARLAERVTQLEQDNNADIAVVILPATQFYTMGDDLDVYAQGLMDDWDMGATTDGRSVLLLVFRDDRELRLEVTGDFDGDVDAAAQSVITDVIVPRFREDDFGGGISLGVDGIANQILAAAETPADTGTATAEEPASGDDATSEGGSGVLIWIGGAIAAIAALVVGAKRRAAAKLAATPCASCGKTGLTRERVTTREPTYDAAGEGEVRTTCPHCGHVETETYTIAKRTRPEDDKAGDKKSGGASGEW